VKWSAKREVSKPPLMQYMELGFVLNDAMDPAAASTKARKPVFNGEVMKALMMHGFHPLAASSGDTDTMHFDYLEGNAAAFGNVSYNVKFSPKGRSGG
jgi:hypothetical protein